MLLLEAIFISLEIIKLPNKNLPIFLILNWKIKLKFNISRRQLLTYWESQFKNKIVSFFFRDLSNHYYCN